MATALGAKSEAMAGGWAPASVPPWMTEGFVSKPDSKLHRTASGVPQTPSGSHLQCPTPILSTRETSHTRDRAAGLTWLCADLLLPATFARVKNQQCQRSVEHTANSLGHWDLFVPENMKKPNQTSPAIICKPRV